MALLEREREVVSHSTHSEFIHVDVWVIDGPETLDEIGEFLRNLSFHAQWIGSVQLQLMAGF